MLFFTGKYIRVSESPKSGIVYSMFSSNFLNLLSKHFFFLQMTYSVILKALKIPQNKKSGLKQVLFISWKSSKINAMQFQWQFLITNPGLWLVNILLCKFNTSSKKEMKMIKAQSFNERQEKNVIKVYVNRELHCLYWTPSTDP